MTAKTGRQATRERTRVSAPTARDGARRLVHAVLVNRRRLTDAAARMGLEGPEAARASRLAALVLRHLARIDACLAQYLARPPTPAVRMILRLGVAELMLDGAAPHGVVHDAVATARASARTAHQAGLVNAVLRKVAGTMPDAWAALPAPVLPPWLRKRVARAFGKHRCAAIEAAHLKGAPLDLTLRGACPDNLGAGQTLPTGSVRVHGAGQITALPGYQDGAFWVQDAAAAIAVKTLGRVAGARVLDLCAAPGGKTMQLAAGGADVTALDVSPARLKRLKANLVRTRLAARIVCADALSWTPEGTFDAIVIDAPCSATGTMRRHPDLAFVRTSAELAALTDLQTRLIDRAMGWLRPGGRAVYCTCSLLPAEGEHQLAAALERHRHIAPVRLDPAAFGLPEACSVPDAHAAGLRLLPDLWAGWGGLDGFFIAQVRRLE